MNGMKVIKAIVKIKFMMVAQKTPTKDEKIVLNFKNNKIYM